MTPANDNDPARHASTVLRHVLKGRPDARVLMDAGLAYARTSDPTGMDLTLAIAGADVVAVAKRLLRNGEDLTTTGRALKPYKTDQQARAWATAKLECALNMLQWHPQRIEQERLLAHWRAYAADQRAIKAAKAAVPLR